MPIGQSVSRIKSLSRSLSIPTSNQKMTLELLTRIEIITEDTIETNKVKMVKTNKEMTKII